MKAFFYYTLCTIKNKPWSFLLLYLASPILLVFYMGLVNPDKTEYKLNLPKYTVKIIDEDKSKASTNLIGILNSEEFKSIINIADKDAEKYEYQLRIPKGYQDAIEKNSDLEIIIQIEKKASVEYAGYLRRLIKNINKALIKNHLINKEIVKISKTDIEKAKKIQQEYIELQKQSATVLGKIKFYEVNEIVDTRKKNAINFILFIFFTFLLEPLQTAVKKKDNGMRLRINSFALKPAYIFTGYVFQVAIKSFIAVILYIAFFRILNIAFMINPLIILIYALIFSFASGSIAEFLMSFKNKEIVLTITIILFFATTVFGLIETPGLKNGTISTMRNFNPIIVFSKPLMLVTEGAEKLEIIKSFIILFATGLVFFGSGIVINSLRKNKI